MARKTKITPWTLMDASGLGLRIREPVHPKRGRQHVEPQGHNPTKITAVQAQRGMTNKATDSGPSNGRGDRRDTSRAYTGNRRVHANHANPAGGHGRSAPKR